MMQAGSRITMQPGFHAPSDSRFSTSINTALLNPPQGGKEWQMELYSSDYYGRVEKKWNFNDGLPIVTYSYEYNSQNAITKTTVQISADSFYQFYEYDRNWSR